MAKFRNRQSGETFDVSDDRAQLFAALPGRYEPVSVYVCAECNETFKSPQALGGHARSHDES